MCRYNALKIYNFCKQMYNIMLIRGSNVLFPCNRIPRNRTTSQGLFRYDRLVQENKFVHY